MKVKERFSQLFTTGPQQAEMKWSGRTVEFSARSAERTYEVGVGKLSKARDYALRCNGNLQITIRWLSVFVYCRWSYTTASVDIARRIATSLKVVGQNPTSRIGMQLFKYHNDREATQQREWLPVPSEI